MNIFIYSLVQMRRFVFDYELCNKFVSLMSRVKTTIYYQVGFYSLKIKKIETVMDDCHF